jgi:hypothetical protein
MQDNGTAVDRREAGPVSPVITREDGWLGDDDRDQSLVLRLRLPISANELAAALYDDDELCPADLAADENVWGFAAVAIVHDGLAAVQRRAEEIAVAEMQGTLASPAWLATCRRRVAEVTGTVVAEVTGTVVAEVTGTAPQARSGLAAVRALTEAASPCHAGAQV